MTTDALAVTHILTGIDDDIDQDLRAIGVELTPGVEQDMEDSRRQAMAALLFRRIRGRELAIGTLRDAMELELAAIRECYERQIAPLAADVAQITGVIEEIAQLTTWGKKKSAETPYGIYGVRESEATVECTDRQALTVWAATAIPALVRMKVTLPYAAAVERFTETELNELATGDVEWNAVKKQLDPNGDLPPGVARVPAKKVPYAKPRAA
jgi:hypothetical protein